MSIDLGAKIKYIRCIRCGRLLKDAEAKERGYGPICWQKISVDGQLSLFDLDNTAKSLLQTPE